MRSVRRLLVIALLLMVGWLWLSRAEGPEIEEEDFALFLPRIAAAVDWNADA